MRFEHLISTMHQAGIAFVDDLKCRADILVVNQCESDWEISGSDKFGNNVRMVSVHERGLSNSRNMLLANATGEIVSIGDDDLVYLPSYIETIDAAYERHPDADIIVFSFTQSFECNTRRQFTKERKLNMLAISKAASVEVTFKTDRIRSVGLQFDTLLGLGAKYGACEENAFLADALRAGLKIWYVPETICYLCPDPPERVKWQNGFDKDYFIKRGACFYRIYKSAFIPFSLAFLIMKKRNIFKSISILKAFLWMMHGKRDYLQEEGKHHVLKHHHSNL